MFFSKIKTKNTFIFSRKRKINPHFEIKMLPFLFFYISKLLLFFGIILILLNNLQLISPGTYFGIYENWVTILVFSFGLIINFVSIPFLYFSSFNKFKQENDLWDDELFWILPMFFFGTFYLHGSNLSGSIFMALLSVVIIIAIHFKLILDSKKIFNENRDEISKFHSQYFMNLQYLSIYYVIFFFLISYFNPLHNLFIWFRWGV